MKPSSKQRVQVTPRLLGKDADRLRDEAYRRGVTAAGLSATIIEAWIQANCPAEREEVAK